MFANHKSPDNRATVGSDSISTSAPIDTIGARASMQSSRQIDSIRNAMSKYRAMTHASRPSLRSREHPLAIINRAKQDTIPTDSISADSTRVQQDSTATQAIVLPPDSLDYERADAEIEAMTTVADTTRPKIVREKVDIDNPVDFTAKDSLVMFGQNTAFMYGSSEVKYNDINLTADEIRMDMQKSLVYAVGRKDTTDEIVGSPVFKDRSGEYESKTMTYNFKTTKGFITDVITQQGEGYLTGGETKKLDDGSYNIINGRYTTCDNHEHPHFYMQLTKGKMRPKKNIVTGPAYMVLCDVPLPLAVPFGYFPFTSKYSSGIIFPTFGDDYQKGFYLSNGGYYFAINDYVDLALTGEIYTKGSWGLAAQSSYRKRYKFSGNFNISYLTTITGDKGSPDYSKQKNFRVAWTHSQDAKANPNMTFSASVNFATSGYSRNDINSYYDTLRAELVCGSGYKCFIVYRRGVYGDFVRSCQKDIPEIISCSDSSSDCQRNENFFCGTFYNIVNCTSFFMCCGYVEKNNLIGVLTVVFFSNLNGITHIGQVDKIYSLDHPTSVYIKARDYSFC